MFITLGWSSDRSSVTSQLSHDSGAHSDSPEERKVTVLNLLLTP